MESERIELGLKALGYTLEFDYFRVFSRYDTWEKIMVFSYKGSVYALGDGGQMGEIFGEMWAVLYEVVENLEEVRHVPLMAELNGYDETAEVLKGKYTELLKRLQFEALRGSSNTENPSDSSHYRWI